MNRRRRPLTSHEVIVETIATTTRTGRTVHAELDTAEYPAGVKIADQDMKTLETTGILTRHTRHPFATPSTANGTTHCTRQTTRPNPARLIRHRL